MAIPPAWDVETIERVLQSKDADIVQRMMALFYARFHDTEASVKALEQGLWHPSVLLRHEIAYVLGQMTQESALPTLISLCDNLDEHPMVRHEAGEALNALGIVSDAVFDCVKRHLNDPCEPVRQTFELAYRGLQRKAEGKSRTKQRDPTKGFYIFTASQRDDATPSNFATTKDPTEGDKEKQSPEQVETLRQLLCDENAELWDRYVAMFTLRNINTPAAAVALAAALDEKSSCLLRHEICFVLGQMQLPDCLSKLIERVEDLQEASMARHEAALALGSVGADIWSDRGKQARLECIRILKKYASDPDPIVAESCVVALHNIEWETGIPNES